MRKKKIPFIVITGVALLFLVACAGNKDAENTQKGMEAIELMQYAEAQTYFDAALECEETPQEIYRGKGIAFMGTMEYESALECFEQALSYGGYIPSDIEYDINYYMAVCYYKLGLYDEAISRYDAILQLRPKSVDAYFQRGIVELEKGMSDVAVADFDKAISLDRKNYGLYIDVFSAMRDKGYEEKGKDYLTVAMDAGDKSMDSYDKGRLYFYLEDYTNARNFLEQARSDGNRSEEVILLLGQSYEELNDSNYALKLYEDYVVQSPSGSIYNQMGLCYFGTGDYESAVSAFEKGLSVQESTCRQQLAYNQIVAYENMGKFEIAKSLMAGYLKTYPDDAEAAREYEFLQSR